MPVIDYWREHAPEVFPDIQASWIGWYEPFCFRCGWLPPLPEVDPYQRWTAIGGWLELAHLQDHCAGGSDKPENLVPLCEFCHHAMPEFPEGRDRAIAWVRAGQPVSCSEWWQLATDGWWGGDQFIRYPGWTAIYRASRMVDALVARHQHKDLVGAGDAA